MFFIARIVCQSLLPGTPSDLVEEAKALSTQIDATLPSAPQMLSDDPGERCPACNVPIPLVDVTNAVCSNGHTWCALWGYSGMTFR
jgi:general transcription factor 3C protein 4